LEQVTYSFVAITANVLGDAMADLERPERLQIMLSPDELEALENWRFEKRMPSRAAAVRELLRRGLMADGFVTAGSGVKSQDFGVVGRHEDGISEDGAT
jgi:hypothetical protein